MTTNVSAVLNSGACNSAVARWCNDNGFVLYTYGWDEIHNGHYYSWNNDSNSYVLRDDLLEIVPEKDEPAEFHYRCQVTASVIATLKRMMR